MPTYTDIVKFEAEAPQHVIRLVKSGGFYRAYNHSAWLFHSCIAEHKVVRKYVKTLKSDVYYIGFPEESLFNTIGDRHSSKTEHGFDIELKEDELPEETEYEQWLERIQALPSSAGDFHSLPLAGADAEREVIRKLREFPFESKSLIDCVSFLAELRQLLFNK